MGVKFREKVKGSGVWWIIICHGEEYKCAELASTLYKKFGIETRAPMNLETIRLK